MVKLLLLARRFVAALCLLAAGTAAFGADRDDDDPPARVGRFAELQGGVSVYDAEQGRWEPAERNRPLTTGDRIATDDSGRAVLRIGSTTLRVAHDSELEVLRLDDARIRLQLHDGGLGLRVRSRELADEIDIVTDEVRLRPLRAGHYRIDRSGDSTWAASLRGDLRADDNGDSFDVDTGQRDEFWSEDRRLQRRSARWPDDEFGAWLAREDRNEQRFASERYVSPEMTGAEDLDRHGRWEQHPEYGAVWMPIVVAPGWAPYRYGRWAWVRPWGWTWVDEAPWGFAPFHYGRWVSWGGRWAWSPGGYVARPVYAPALVAWVGGPSFGVSISIGGPTVGWVPLAPREVFVPYYRSTPRYRERVNIHPGHRMREVPGGGPIVYGNQGSALTVVARDVLERRQPVQRGVIEVREPVQRLQPVQPDAPVLQPAPRHQTRLPVPYERRRPETSPDRDRPVVGERPPRERITPQPQPRDREERVPQRGRDGDRDGNSGRDRDRSGDRDDRPQRPDATQPVRPTPAVQAPAQPVVGQRPVQQPPAQQAPVLRQRPDERGNGRADDERRRVPEQRPRERAPELAR